MDSAAFNARLDLLMPASDAGAGLRFADLFSGMGGFHYALLKLGMQCTLAAERDTDTRAFYAARFPESVESLLRAGRFADDVWTMRSHQDVDILCAGFPCQPFSIGGHRLGLSEERGRLIYALLDRISEIQPRAFILENVKGLTHRNMSRAFAFICRELDQMGYDVSWRVYSAVDFGIPQDRKRIFIAGFKRYVTQMTIPDPDNPVLAYQDGDPIVSGGKGDWRFPDPLPQNHPDHITFKEFVGGRPVTFSKVGKRLVEVEMFAAKTLTVGGRGVRGKGSAVEKAQNPRAKHPLVYPDDGGEPTHEDWSMEQRLNLMGFRSDFFDCLPKLTEATRNRMTGNGVTPPVIYRIALSMIPRVRQLIAEHPVIPHVASGSRPNFLFRPVRREVVTTPPAVNPGRDFHANGLRKRKGRAKIRRGPSRLPVLPSNGRRSTLTNPEVASAPTTLLTPFEQLLIDTGIAEHVEYRDQGHETTAFIARLDDQIRLARTVQAARIDKPPRGAWFRHVGEQIVSDIRHGKAVIDRIMCKDYDALDKAFCCIRTFAATMSMENLLCQTAGRPLRGVSYASTEDIDPADFCPILTVPFDSHHPPMKGYTGSKVDLIDLLADQLMPLMTQRGCLVEPFGGSGAVGFNFAYRADRYGMGTREWRFVIADNNPDIIDIMQRLSDPHERPKLERATRKLWTEAERRRDKGESFVEVFKSFRERVNDLPRNNASKLKVAALILWIQQHSHNKALRYNSDGEINITPDTRTKWRPYPADKYALFADVSIARSFTFNVSSFEDTMAAAMPGDVVYCDPPYADDRGKTPNTPYYSGLWKPANQQALVKAAIACKERGIPVLISNSDNAFTRTLYDSADELIVGINAKERMTGEDRSELIACYIP